jgi:ABC-type nitrate/sulfonate/bicarbonate transport system permease component
MKTRILIILVLLAAAFAATFAVNIDAGRLVQHAGSSLARMLAGYTISVVISLAFAVFLGLSRYLRMAFKPVLSFFISIPTITWVPLLLVVTGISEQTIIIAIFLGSFFAITFNTLDGFDNVRRSQIRAGRILGYGRVKILTRIMIPASFNSILVGLKLGIAYSWRALVGAEMLGAAQVGLGYLVFASRKFYDLKLMLLALALIGALGFLLNRILVDAVERNTIVKWGIK